MLNNDTLQSLLADRDLVKAMVQNLGCISYSGAKEIHDALVCRAQDTDARKNIVPAKAAAEALQILPAFPVERQQDADYRYRADMATIRKVWSVLDSATAAAISA